VELEKDIMENGENGRFDDSSLINEEIEWLVFGSLGAAFGCAPPNSRGRKDVALAEQLASRLLESCTVQNESQLALVKTLLNSCRPDEENSAAIDFVHSCIQTLQTFSSDQLKSEIPGHMESPLSNSYNSVDAILLRSLISTIVQNNAQTNPNSTGNPEATPQYQALVRVAFTTVAYLWNTRAISSAIDPQNESKSSPGNATPWCVLEATLTSLLFAKMMEPEADSNSVQLMNESRKKSQSSKMYRWAAIGTGGVLGGVLIGLTAGFAAPALVPAMVAVSGGIAAPLAAMPATGAAVLLGTAFGSVGAATTARSLNRRLRGVSEMSLEACNLSAVRSAHMEPLSVPAGKKVERIFTLDSVEDTTSIVWSYASESASTFGVQFTPLTQEMKKEVEGTIPETKDENETSKKREKDTWILPLSTTNGKEMESSDMSARRGEILCVSAGLYKLIFSNKDAWYYDQKVSFNARVMTRKSNKVEETESKINEIVLDEHEQNSRDMNPSSDSVLSPAVEIERHLPSIHVVLFVPGILERKSMFYTGWESAPGVGAFSDPFKELAESVLPISECLAVRWESKLVADFSGDLLRFVARYAVDSLQSAAAKSLLPALTGALAFPLTLLSLTSYIDNQWSVLLNRSQLAGYALAWWITDGYFGKRPITLAGHSFGARLIFHCLLKLSELGQMDMIDHAYLFGAPVSTDAKEWNTIRKVVAGRLVNGYCTQDFALGLFHRSASFGWNIAGLSPVEQAGIENVCLDQYGIRGHSDYASKTPELFRRIAFQDAMDDLSRPMSDSSTQLLDMYGYKPRIIPENEESDINDSAHSEIAHKPSEITSEIK